MKSIAPAAALKLITAKTAMMIDVREADEYDYENIPGSLLQSLSFFDAELFPDLKDKTLIIMCKAGMRSAAVIKQLEEVGYSDIYNLEGGIVAWEEAKFETEGKKYEALDYQI
ncbi:MAG: sulfurtransferase [Rhodospirillaceae bacterium]|nr:MAG: sulfurtransferase [Rhodospirillaceae bacterium]